MSYDWQEVAMFGMMFAVLAALGIADSCGEKNASVECVKAGGEWVDAECRRKR